MKSQIKIQLAMPSIFNQCVVAHWCATCILQEISRAIEGCDLPTGNTVCLVACFKKKMVCLEHFQAMRFKKRSWKSLGLCNNVISHLLHDLWKHRITHVTNLGNITLIFYHPDLCPVGTSHSKKKNSYIMLWYDTVLMIPNWLGSSLWLIMKTPCLEKLLQPCQFRSRMPLQVTLDNL